MKPADAIKVIGVSDDTLKRWGRQYRDFFSPAATPPKGQTREYTPHDIRLALKILALRDAGLTYEAIKESLEAEQENGWEGLPPMPDIEALRETLPADVAASRANEMVQNAVLQRELAHVRQELELAQGRVLELEASMSTLQTSKTEVEGAKHALELDLERARADVRELQARLQGYTIGGDKPIAPAILIIMTLLAGALLVTLAFVVARLVM